MNADRARHWQLERSVGDLWERGVRVPYGPDGFVPHRPGREKPGEYPWHLVLGEVERVAGRGA
ncbi:hypothetical protein [Streptomyces sp. NPDC049590]|uniref:hypothetical protein n=1 Tax=Streptomyces sp. NPDC049590 TaxID=3154834 RepID=UPI003440A2BB